MAWLFTLSVLYALLISPSMAFHRTSPKQNRIRGADVSALESLLAQPKAQTGYPVRLIFSKSWYASDDRQQLAQPCFTRSSGNLNDPRQDSPNCSTVVSNYRVGPFISASFGGYINTK